MELTDEVDPSMRWTALDDLLLAAESFTDDEIEAVLDHLGRRLAVMSAPLNASHTPRGDRR